VAFFFSFFWTCAGLEATKRIVATLAKTTKPMIVAVTANALEENRQACLEAGMDMVVCKPVVMDDVERVLAARVENQKKEEGAQ